MSGAIGNERQSRKTAMKGPHERWHTGATWVAHRRLALVPIAPL